MKKKIKKNHKDTKLESEIKQDVGKDEKEGKSWKSSKEHGISDISDEIHSGSEQNERSDSKKSHEKKKRKVDSADSENDPTSRMKKLKKDKDCLDSRSREPVILKHVEESVKNGKNKKTSFKINLETLDDVDSDSSKVQTKPIIASKKKKKNLCLAIKDKNSPKSDSQDNSSEIIQKHKKHKEKVDKSVAITADSEADSHNEKPECISKIKNKKRDTLKDVTKREKKLHTKHLHISDFEDEPSNKKEPIDFSEEFEAEESERILEKIKVKKMQSSHAKKKRNVDSADSENDPTSRVKKLKKDKDCLDNRSREPVILKYVEESVKNGKNKKTSFKTLDEPSIKKEPIDFSEEFEAEESEQILEKIKMEIKEETSIENKTDSCSDSDSNRKESSPIVKINNSVDEKIDFNGSYNNSNENDSSTDDDFSDFTPRRKKIRIPPKVVKINRIVQSTSEGAIPPQNCPKFDEELASKLSSLNVNLFHEVPPQHQIERYPGTTVLSAKEKKEFSEYIDIKKGPFDPQEDELIIRNWKKFCKKHDWKKSMFYPFTHLKGKGFYFLSSVENRRKFVQFLAKDLNDRTLYSVYHRFRNIFDSAKRGRFTKGEDLIIWEALSNAGPPEAAKKDKIYSNLAKKLNRTRCAVWRRAILLMQKKVDD